MNNARSSSGKTPGLGPGNEGSNPSLATNGPMAESVDAQTPKVCSFRNESSNLSRATKKIEGD